METQAPALPVPPLTEEQKAAPKPGKWSLERLTRVKERVAIERAAMNSGSPSDSDIGQEQLASMALDYLPGLIEAVADMPGLIADNESLAFEKCQAEEEVARLSLLLEEERARMRELALVLEVEEGGPVLPALTALIGKKVDLRGQLEEERRTVASLREQLPPEGDSGLRAIQSLDDYFREAGHKAALANLRAVAHNMGWCLDDMGCDQIVPTDGICPLCQYDAAPRPAPAPVKPNPYAMPELAAQVRKAAHEIGYAAKKEPAPTCQRDCQKCEKGISAAETEAIPRKGQWWRGKKDSVQRALIMGVRPGLTKLVDFKATGLRDATEEDMAHRACHTKQLRTFLRDYELEAAAGGAGVGLQGEPGELWDVDPKKVQPYEQYYAACVKSGSTRLGKKDWQKQQKLAAKRTAGLQGEEGKGASRRLSADELPPHGEYVAVWWDKHEAPEIRYYDHEGEHWVGGNGTWSGRNAFPEWAPLPA